ncbi:MAG: hypothetical protein PVJ50_11610 [Desulfobacterales bacterium]|jgi:hypothetical protein
MVHHIAQSKKVNFTIILDSINGYLLFGILGAVLLVMAELLQKFLYHLNTGAINFAGGTAQGFHDFLYFSFVPLQRQDMDISQRLQRLQNQSR